MYVLHKLPYAGVIVASGILIALLVWARWPRDPLVINQEDITKPFQGKFGHPNPPSFTRVGGR